MSGEGHTVPKYTESVEDLTKEREELEKLYGELDVAADEVMKAELVLEGFQKSIAAVKYTLDYLRGRIVSLEEEMKDKGIDRSQVIDGRKEQVQMLEENEQQLEREIDQARTRRDEAIRKHEKIQKEYNEKVALAELSEGTKN